MSCIARVVSVANIYNVIEQVISSNFHRRWHVSKDGTSSATHFDYAALAAESSPPAEPTAALTAKLR